MNGNRILLAIVASLLLINLGAMLSPPAHALGKTQYKALELEIAGARNVQKILDQESAQGWEYVGMILNTLVFKK